LIKINLISKFAVYRDMIYTVIINHERKYTNEELRSYFFISK